MWQGPDIGENVELIMLDTGNDKGPVILVNTTVVRVSTLKNFIIFSQVFRLKNFFFRE